jgi:hypothetical protein
MKGTNVGAFITSRLAIDPNTVGAGVGGAAVEQVGPSFDRTAYKPLHLSGKLQVGYVATLASGHTMSITAGMRHCDTSGGSYTDIDTASGVAAVTANNDGSAVRGVLEVDVNLIGAKEFLKARLTPVMSHSGVDSIKLGGILALGGGEDAAPATLTAL